MDSYGDPGQTSQMSKVIFLGLLAVAMLFATTPVHAAGGHVRIELKRLPFNKKRVRVIRFERALKIGFSDVTPRANGVGQYVEFDHARLRPARCI